MGKKTNVGRLEGRTALVTGGTRGIGKAIVLRLLQEDARVVTCGREASALRILQEEVEMMGAGGRFLSAVADVTKKEAINQLHDFIVICWGQLDILVNNVGGVRQFGTLHQINPEHWQEVFDENLMTTVNVTAAMLPLLKGSQYGNVVNIASVAGVQAGYYNGHYGSIKAAQVQFTKYLANNYGKDGIRANVVCPSTIMGGVWGRDVRNKAQGENISYEDAEQKLLAEVRSKSVLGRIGTPEDVAATVAFLASEDARMITGSCIKVDGGTVRGI